MTKHDAPTLCPECYEPMTSVSAPLQPEEVPKLFAFYCAPCGFAETKEQKNEQITRAPSVLA